MKAVVAAFNQEKALVGAFSAITNLRMELFETLDGMLSSDWLLVQIKQLETEVTRIKGRKHELVTDHEKLLQQRATWSDLVKRLHDYVLKVGELQ